MGNRACSPTVRKPEGTICLYTKGADTVIFQRLHRRGATEFATEAALAVSPCREEGWCVCVCVCRDRRRRQGRRLYREMNGCGYLGWLCTVG